MIDPRIITAIGLFVVGTAAMTLALRVWWTHPINRVFTLGPYLTNNGYRVVLDHSPTVFALGAFAQISAATRLAYSARWEGYLSSTVAEFFGYAEAGTAIWAAGAVLWTAYQLGWRKR